MYKILKTYDRKILPIYVSLPTLSNPLTKLVTETLKNVYGFDKRKITEFKEKCQGLGDKPPEYNLMFI